jgi:hypothetical protein
MALVFQQKASDTHLGLPKTLNANLLAVLKAKTILMECKAAKKNHEMQSSIRIDALLFKLDMVRGQEQMIEVCHHK